MDSNISLTSTGAPALVWKMTVNRLTLVYDEDTEIGEPKYI